MSGGRFNFADENLRSELFGYTSKPVNVFEDIEISELVWDVLELIKEYDWYKCGDNCEEAYLKAKASFKKKWLNEDSKSAHYKRIIDEAVADCKITLYKTFGVEETDEDNGD